MSQQNFALRFRASAYVADHLYRKVAADSCFDNVGIRLLEPTSVDVMSIQVAATCHADDNIAVVPEASGSKTHYSVYVRDWKGVCSINRDFPLVFNGMQCPARESALALAAELSMKHQAPIEKIH